jgi:hypothetical protein
MANAEDDHRITVDCKDDAVRRSPAQAEQQLPKAPVDAWVLKCHTATLWLLPQRIDRGLNTDVTSERPARANDLPTTSRAIAEDQISRDR